MGSTWRSADTVSYASYSAVNSAKSVQQVFAQRKIEESLDPRNVMLRECVDGPDNPNSTPIIVGVDVTASMGYLAKEIAVNGLGKIIKGVYDTKPVSDPNIAFCAIGDAVYDSAPLQFSQFEGDMRIVTELEKIYVESGGGGNQTEGYDLPWIFAAERTKIDSFEKRGEKGFLFTIGDEPAPEGISAENYSRVFGGQASTAYTAEQALRAAEEKWEVFHILLEESSWMQSYREKVVPGWEKLLGSRVLILDDHQHLPEVIVAVMEISRGADPEDVLAVQQDATVQQSIKHALRLD